MTAATINRTNIDDRRVITSAIVSSGTVIEVTDKFLDWHPHVFVGAQFFSDAAGLSKVVPSGGEVYFNIRPVTTEQYEPFSTETVQADTPETVSAAAPPYSGIKATPSAIAGAAFWRIVVATYRQ